MSKECCETCEYSVDYGESVDYIKCAEAKKEKHVKKLHCCHNYIPSKKFKSDLKFKADVQDKISKLNTLNNAIEKGKITPKEYLEEIKDVVKKEENYTYRGLI